MTVLRFRCAGPDDADQVALLHADSWRRHYRGAYADSFLDGDVVADRRAVWQARLATPAAKAETILAEHQHDGRLLGFIHVAFDEDPRWGSLVDNLHVSHELRRAGIGTRLLAHGAGAVTRRATTGTGMYLWVLQQNTEAQQFYRARGAAPAESAAVTPPGGDPARLNGTPRSLRMVWPDASLLARS
ncbi:GNAT family N-acetyltransferase [Allorhizocola rhizosphaerae]|uniref:GNAT family N-acetyltransferase n=1 Tax=Allorhizocola rhizosphaerae TaxID=1872709 RepID=UPI000E3DEFC1|nr:GNAT family N-acetyltransferase [Allorhizocola rhizosphaerae]